MLAIPNPSARLDSLHAPAACAAAAASVSGPSTEQGDDDADGQLRRCPDPCHGVLDRLPTRPSPARRGDGATNSSASESSASRSLGRAACSSSRRRSSRGGGPSDEHEQRVQRHRGDAREGGLGDVNSGPGALVVNVGRTRQSTASVATVASAVAVPSALNDATWSRSARQRTRSSSAPVRPGSFRLSATADDPETSVTQVEFPDVSAVSGWSGSTGGVDTTSPYAAPADYSWSSGATAPGARSIVATNGASLTNSDGITLAADADAPTASRSRSRAPTPRTTTRSRSPSRWRRQRRFRLRP